MADSFYDGSSYDPETVRFYDVAYEGAQVRLIGGLVSDGALTPVTGLRPRSVVILSRDQISRSCAQVVAELRAPLRQPFVITSAMPGYLGPLDVLIVCSDDGGDEAALRALITAAHRGVSTVLIGPASAPLLDEAPSDTVVIPTLPTAASLSPARIVASISAVVDLFEEDPQIVAERLQHVADHLDEEVATLSPERDELVNPGRQLRLAAEGRRVVHTGRTPLGLAIANAVAALWTRRGLVSAAMDFPELVEALPELRGPVPAGDSIFHDPFLDPDPGVVPFRAVVWADAEPGIPEAVAQHCELPGRGPLASTLRLIVRGLSATVYVVEEKDL